MTLEADAEDLAHHEQEMHDREGYNYAVLNAAETELFGCVYLYPSESPEHDADVSWWVVDPAAGTELDLVLAGFLPRWFTGTWPFRAPRTFP